MMMPHLPEQMHADGSIIFGSALKSNPADRNRRLRVTFRKASTMQEFPHHYSVSAAMQPAAEVELSSHGLDAIESLPPVEFGGPGDKWSPETLLVAAVADCFALSFRAIAAASRFEWIDLKCDVGGTVDRLADGTQFTGFTVHATLTLPAIADEARARKLLEKAEHACLITKSLKARSELQILLQKPE
jgi:organic hydroperoxide reductase OsmC/OhrA